jgi:hypothetical protein
MAGKAKELTFTHHFSDIDTYEVDEDELEKVKEQIYTILLDAFYEGRI